MEKVRNLRIRAKILLAFGVIIALMCLAVVFVVFSNLNTLDNVNSISEDISFQHELNDVLESFNKANIQANVLYKVLDQDANKAFAELASIAEQNFQIVLAHIDSHTAFEAFRPEIEDAYTQFSAWKIAVEELAARNNDLEEGRKIFSSSGSELVGSVAFFMEFQVTGNVTPGQLSLAHKINDGITAFRLSSRTFHIHSTPAMSTKL